LSGRSCKLQKSATDAFPTFRPFTKSWINKVSEAGRRLATVLLAPAVFGRPMVAAPGVPPARVKILRDAYHRSLKDPGLLEELKKRRWVVDAIGGEEMAALAREVIAQPPEIIERMKKLLGS
ncbi:MAG TPA: hypothetical protein VE170_11530, partial [Candidatus Limnocylindria bacterium]|nr:hypothetical protein [Candidatus Limnocylindria bacterium]